LKLESGQGRHRFAPGAHGLIVPRYRPPDLKCR
jgi:hypothetical protein